MKNLATTPAAHCLRSVFIKTANKTDYFIVGVQMTNSQLYQQRLGVPKLNFAQGCIKAWAGPISLSHAQLCCIDMWCDAFILRSSLYLQIVGLTTAGLLCADSYTLFNNITFNKPRSGTQSQDNQ